MSHITFGVNRSAPSQILLVFAYIVGNVVLFECGSSQELANKRQKSSFSPINAKNFYNLKLDLEMISFHLDDMVLI